MTDNRIFVMMAGIPGSGKSTLANTIAKAIDGQIISSDRIRGELHGDESCQDDPELIFDTIYDRIEAFAPYTNVVYDATNYLKHYRAEVLRHVYGRYDLVFCVYQNGYPTLEDCLKNNLKRKRQVPYKVICNMWNKFECPKPIEGFDACITFDQLFDWLYDVVEGDILEWTSCTNTHSDKARS